MRNVEILTQTQTDIITLSELKDRLEISTTEHDDAYEALIDAVSDFIKSYTEYDWVETTYLEKIDGHDLNSIVLSNKPLVELKSLAIGDKEPTEDEYVVYEKQAIIKLVNKYFNKGSQNVEVEYTAGYSDIPDNIKDICVDLINYKFNQRDYPGIESYSIGDESIKFGKNDIPDEILNQLDNNSKVRW